MPETGKEERMRTRAKAFDMAKIFFLLSVIPLVLMALLMLNGVSTDGPAPEQEITLQAKPDTVLTGTL